jgi:hypothetical protein
MKEVFEGKTVSLVGNAKSLFSTKYGQEIDSAEVVCRIKRGFFQLRPTDSISHGKKTDVWFLNWFKTMKPNRVTNKTCDHVVEILYHQDIDIEWLKNELGHHRPSTGLRILHLISLYNPKRVYVYGFDWKASPSFHDKKLQDDRHNFSLEKEYCMKRFFNSKNETFVLRK